jgi:hypothetical protein
MHHRHRVDGWTTNCIKCHRGRRVCRVGLRGGRGIIIRYWIWELHKHIWVHWWQFSDHELEWQKGCTNSEGCFEILTQTRRTNCQDKKREQLVLCFSKACQHHRPSWLSSNNYNGRQHNHVLTSMLSCSQPFIEHIAEKSMINQRRTFCRAFSKPAHSQTMINTYLINQANQSYTRNN